MKSEFVDVMGERWDVEFDGLLLDEVYEKTGVDLADISAGGLSEVEQDAKKLVRVLVVVCSERMAQRGKSERELSKRIRGEAIDNAVEAIVSAAANFFPPSRWSEIQSRLIQQREVSQQWAAMGPMVKKLHDPSMPPAMRDAVMAAIAEGINSGIDGPPITASTSQPLPDSQSATGPDVTPPTLAPEVLENAGFVQTG